MHFNEQYMRHLPRVIAVLLVIFSACNRSDDFLFGVKYNSTRQRFGSPLIQHNMKASYCCGIGTIYQINKVPDDSKAYHFSKSITAITNNKLTEEKDIFRKNVDDSTILQLNLLTLWPWESRKFLIEANLGKIDRRTLKLRASEFLGNYSKYPNYRFKELDQGQIDSVLNSWGLSRFDKE
jgi:hypothetical protein